MRTGIATLLLLLVGACGSKNDYPVLPSEHPDAHMACGLVTCASTGAACGLIGDGCGDTVDCGTCASGEQCGTGGTPFACGPGCAPHTCGDAGAACGKVSDGCGGLTADCGSCPTGQSCGVIAANQCGVPPCIGLCAQQNACPAQPQTTITGRVTAPGHTDVATWGPPDPIFGALVYVPDGPAGPPTYGVAPFSSGVSCDTCSSVVTGSPLVSTTTAVDGTFTLDNAPCGTQIPLVIQLGRWRRMITIPSVACCASTALTAEQTHLPRNHTGDPGDLRSDIPRIAVSTGAVDTLHCVLRKMGIDDAEFTNPTGSGRVRMYADNGAVINASTPAASLLYTHASELAEYDMVLFECVGDQEPKAAGDQQLVIDYANAGGRVFATHFSYVWLTTPTTSGPKPFSQTAGWDVDQNPETSPRSPRRSIRARRATPRRRRGGSRSRPWLAELGASPSLGQIDVQVPRRDFDAVSATPGTADGTPAQRWLFAGTAPLSYSFDTPIAYAPSPRPAERCGVLFNDFHVSDALAAGTTFPAECTDGPMTPEERTLEFMLFDLATCVGPPPSPCVPKTCAEQNIPCGDAGDGCDDGVVLSCGGCPIGEFCGGGTDASGCGTGPCTPRTCMDAGAQCGAIGDGCGGTVDCGPCPGDEMCGAGGVANVCGNILQ